MKTATWRKPLAEWASSYARNNFPRRDLTLSARMSPKVLSRIATRSFTDLWRKTQMC